jgi:molybdate transport system permease protein
LGWLGALVVLYLTVPVGAFAIRLAASHQRGFAAPGLFEALWVSGLSATISAGLVALFGIPLAYVLARSRTRWASVVGTAVQLPLAVPPLVSGLLLIYLVGPYTTLGKYFKHHLTDSVAGIVLAQTFVAAPFLIIAARSAFAAVDPAFDEVAASLGHRPLARFFRVGLPAAAGGIKAGLVLSWLRAFGEYGATVLLAYYPASLPIFIYTQFSSTGLANTEAPTALAFVVAAVVVTLGRARWSWFRRPAGEIVLPAPVPPNPVSAVAVRFDLDVTVGTFRLAAAHQARTGRLAILGPSGSGKSLTLRSVAGILGPRVGSVWFGANEVTGVPVERRSVGYVPQGYSLLPHLDVWRQARFGVGAQPGLAAYWLDGFHLSELAARLPSQLSGGQRQRVCLAQALARQPRLLLLDEPFSALDAPVRAELRHELRRLQREKGLSSVLVTHDPEEAALLADEIIVLLDGRVVQVGSAAELHRRPASAPVARLLGIANILAGRVGADGQLMAGGLQLDIAVPGGVPGAGVSWCIHPEHVELLTARRGSGHAAEVVDAADLGAATSLDLRVGEGLVVRARSGGRRLWQVGDRCSVRFPADAVTVWLGAPPNGDATEARPAAAPAAYLSD